jgi:hypothetical protein
MYLMRPDDGCPVCGRPIDGRPLCAGCDRELHRPLWLGGDPVAEQRDFREVLDRDRRTFDARAAARIDPVDGRFLPQIRGGQPSDEEWAEAVRAVTAVAGLDPRGDLRAALQIAIANLDGAARTGVAEINRTGFTVTEVGADSLGSLRIWGDTTSLTWAELGFSTDPGELLFQLAGQDPLRWRVALDRIVAEVSVEVSVVVCGLPGWRVPESAVNLLMVGHPAAVLVRTTEPVGDQLELLVAEAPLQQPYELLVAAVRPGTREVALQTKQLFARGAEIGSTETLTVRCVPSDVRGTVFAVVTWPGTDDPRLLSAETVKLRPGRYQVRAVLEGPGQVRFIEPAGLVPDDRTWAELMEAVPERLGAAVTKVDLICAVELGGAREEVDARLRLVRELIKMLDEECTEPDQLRIAVLGYSDHIFDSRLEGRRVVSGAWLGAVPDALRAVGRLTAEERSYQAAAPVEDMLAVVASRLGKVRTGRKTVLLTVGSRPPHPARVGMASVLPCPNGCNWDQLLARLERNPDLARIAVMDRPLTRDTAAFWNRMGAASLRHMGDADPRQLGIDIGVLVPHVQRLPFPLFEQERGRQ